jgi:hypothetical protein
MSPGPSSFIRARGDRLGGTGSRWAGRASPPQERGHLSTPGQAPA